MEKKWNILESAPSLVKSLTTTLNVNDIVSHLLVLRGVKNYEQARAFFRPQLSDLHDPFLMKDMNKAVLRIDAAISNNEKVLIYGDYDVDGTTAVAMVWDFLNRYIEKLEYYIPSRHDEGYGISIKGIDYAKENEVSLIIALDCGIKAIKQVDYAAKHGIDFIICDHHKPDRDIPNAVSILNPKQSECSYPYKELSGCGVGFKLIHAYSIRKKIPFADIKEYLDLLVVSIAADVVPMTGENRVLAYYGLEQINSNPRVGLTALIRLADNFKKITISDILFTLAPRINAAGRMKHAKDSVRVLIEKDPVIAKKIAKNIDESNKIRRDIEAKVTSEAIKKIDQNKKSTVVFSDNWHPGVIGIVASRLIENNYKPTVVLTKKDNIFIGSARSVEGFDLYESISKCSYLCETFGGHKYAAGLTIKKENISQFINEFEKIVSLKISKNQLVPKINVDMIIDVENINKKLYRIIKQFAPFGPKNPTPVFVSKGIFDTGFGKKVGKDNSHIKLNIKKGKESISAIGFRMGDCFKEINNSKKFDACYSINENQWQGRKAIQLLIKDIKPHKG